MANTKPLAEQVVFTQVGVGAVARTLADKGRECVSVKDFGAVGDGVTDDRPAFSAAVAYAGSLLAPPSIFIPAGEYLFASSESDAIAMVTLAPNTTIRGEGWQSKIRVGGGALGVKNVFSCPSGSTEKFGTLVFRDFYCDLNGQNNLRLAGEPARNNAVVNACSFTNLVISNIKAENAPGNQVFWAHDPDTTNGKSSAAVIDCEIHTVGATIPGNTNGDHSSSYLTANYCYQYRNRFMNDSMLVATASTAMELHGEFCYMSDNVVINYNRGSHFVSGELGVDMHKAVVRGNYFDTRLAGVALWTLAANDINDVLIAENTFQSSRQYSTKSCAIDAQFFLTGGQLKTIKIIGNKFQDANWTAQTAVIYLGAQVRQAAVQQNQFYSLAMGAIDSSATESLIVDGNVFSDCANSASGDYIIRVLGPCAAVAVTNNTFYQTSYYSENSVWVAGKVDSGYMANNVFHKNFNDYPIYFTGAGLTSSSFYVKMEIRFEGTPGPIAPDVDVYATKGSELVDLRHGYKYARDTAEFGNSWVATAL